MKNSNNFSFFYSLVYVVLSSLLFQNCAVPIFSEMQSARTVGKNNIEVVPYYSFINQTVDGESDGVQNDFGVQTFFGLSDKTDLGFRYEHISVRDEFGGGSYDVIGFIPKFGTGNDRFAFAIPFGTAFGDGVDEIWGIYPTFLATFPIEKNIFDFTIAPKYLFFISPDDTEGYVAINFGFAISEDLSKWSIRPEYGLLYNPEDFNAGHNAHFSIGFSYTFLSKIKESIPN